MNVGTRAINDFHFRKVLIPCVCLHVYRMCVFSSHRLGGKNCKEVVFNQEDSVMQSKCSEAAAKLVAFLAPFHGINTPLAQTKWKHAWPTSSQCSHGHMA